MSDDIEQIKRNLNTARLVSRRASDWIDKSGDVAGRCTHPEHGHTSDSSNAGNLVVFEDGGWYCFSHGTSGSVIDWVAVEEGIVSCSDLTHGLSDSEFVEALEEAADRANVELTGSGDDYDPDTTTRETEARYAMEVAVAAMHSRIDEKIVDGRSIRHHIKDNRSFTDETIDAAKVGYFDGQVQADLLQQLSKDQLKDVGLMRENETWHINERIVYPYFTDGVASYWIGRRTERSEMGAKYLKPSKDTCLFEQPLYTVDSFDRGRDDTVYVVEGIQDALSVAQQGHAAVAPVATNASDLQTSQLAAAADDYPNVVICYDWDESGETRGLEIGEQLMHRGVIADIGTIHIDNHGHVGDPNDLLVDGGHIDDDVDHVPVPERIIDVRGDDEDVIADLLATVEPDTPRADRLVDQIASRTPYRKRTLRKLCKKSYRKEGQSGWIEPDRVQKTDGQNPLWTFRFPGGEKIVLTTEELTDGPSVFQARYVELFNYLPDFKSDEWLEQVNLWLAEVEVTDPSPLTEEGQAREAVLEALERTPTYGTLREAVSNGGGAVKWESGDDTALVPKHTLMNWIEDLEVTLRKAADYLDPYLAHGSTRIRPEGRARVRVWHFDVSAVEDAGYTLETPTLEQTPESEARSLRDVENGPEPTESDDSGDSDDDSDDNDDEFGVGGGVDTGDGPATDGGIDIVGGDEYPPDADVKLHGPPGTGKSTQLLERIAALLEDGYGVGDVAFITYRKEMAADFLQRLYDRDLISEQEMKEPWRHDTRYFGTLHGVCNRLMDEDRDVADRSDKADFCQATYGVEFESESGVGDDTAGDNDRGALLFGLRSWSYENLHPDDQTEWSGYDDLANAWPMHPPLSEFDRAWEDYKHKHGLYDFEDMLWRVYEHGVVPPREVVVVDEYHDFTPLMDAISRQFLTDATTRIVAGDPLQAIYTYKGADPDLFEDLELPEVLLDRTWRVPGEIWDYAASEVLVHDAPPVTPDSEGGVVRHEQRSIPGFVEEYGTDDVLFLARTRSQVRDISKALSEAGIIHRTQARLGGWNTANTRLDLYNILAKLDGVTAPAGLSAEGQSGLQYFDERPAGGRPPSTVPITQTELNKLIRYTPAGYLQGYKKHVTSWASNAGGITADALREHVTDGFWTDLTRGADSVDSLLSYDGKETIARALDHHDRPYPDIEMAPVPDVLTIHASKGMEAETVVVADGVTSAIANSVQSSTEKHHAESRVWYVAATRAAKRLLIAPPQNDYTRPYLPTPSASIADPTNNANADD